MVMPGSDLKEDLVKEVTESVREHLESRTSAVVDLLWQRGQHAVQHLQQHQLSQTEHLQGQLAACAESYRKLERENALLRSSLEALMKHLTQVFGPVPTRAQHPPLFPQMTPGVPQGPVRGDGEDFHTPTDSPKCEPSENLAAADDDPPSLATQNDKALHTPAAPVSKSTSGLAAAPTFTLTLRRADQVPLGLEVQGESGASCLTVSSIRPGGAVEAWNRQCAGDSREIGPGDRIIGINGADNADSMRLECLTKHLLKITVQRSSSQHASQEEAADEGSDAAASVAVSAAEAALGESGMRAEANEFVPSVGPWPVFPSESESAETAATECVAAPEVQ